MRCPIDVIFHQPIDKYTVIYQNGKLWRLPRLDFTGQSLALKKPYTGSREHIFVASQQGLDPDDLSLLSQLTTIHLPPSVVGRNVDQFEDWWATHWLDYQTELASSYQRQLAAKQRLQQPNQMPTPQPASMPSMMTTSELQPTSSHDIFDQMLVELTNSL